MILKIQLSFRETLFIVKTPGEKLSQNENASKVTDTLEPHVESTTLMTVVPVSSDNILDDRGRHNFLKRTTLGGSGALLVWYPPR